MGDPLISVVLPVYNEDKNIQTCLRRIRDALEKAPHEILVCYDFDEDTTLGAIADMSDRPTSVRLVRNRLGKGVAYAMRAGFEAAKGDVVVTTMADLSDPPEIIPLMAEKIRTGGADLVSGSRYMKGGRQEGGPWLKGFLSRTASLSMKWIGGLRTLDATNNFRAYRREFLEQMQVESTMGFELALELTAKAHVGGFRIDEVPTTWIDRTSGESRFRLWKWMPHYLRWYGRVMRAPMAVWGLWLVLGLGLGIFAEESVAVPAGLGSIAAVLIVVSRWRRGRTVWSDLIFPLAWLHPGQVWILQSGKVALYVNSLVLACFLTALGWIKSCPPQPAVSPRE